MFTGEHLAQEGRAPAARCRHQGRLGHGTASIHTTTWNEIGRCNFREKIGAVQEKIGRLGAKAPNQAPTGPQRQYRWPPTGLKGSPQNVENSSQNPVKICDVSIAQVQLLCSSSYFSGWSKVTVVYPAPVWSDGSRKIKLAASASSGSR